MTYYYQDMEDCINCHDMTIILHITSTKQNIKFFLKICAAVLNSSLSKYLGC